MMLRKGVIRMIRKVKFCQGNLIKIVKIRDRKFKLKKKKIL